MSNEDKHSDEEVKRMCAVALCAALVLLSLSIQAFFLMREIQQHDSWSAAFEVTLLGPAMFGLSLAGLVSALRGNL